MPPWPSRIRPGHAALAAVVLAAALLASGCGGNEQSTLAPHGKGAREISSLWWGMLAGAVVVLAVVLVLVAACRRADDRSPCAGAT